MQVDSSRHNGAQTQQCGEIEDVRAEHDAGTHCLLMMGDRGDRSRDLRCVGRQGGQDAQAGFRKSEAFSDALEPGDQKPACCQADPRPREEDSRCGSNRHRGSDPNHLLTGRL